MIDQVTAAFDRKDYKTASRLVKQWLNDSPEDPWAKLFMGKLQAIAGKSDAAEKVFRKLLQETTNPKVAMQARQGLQQLEAQQKAKREAAIAQAKSDPTQTGTGVLILKPMDVEAKATVAQHFAQIMKIDAYTARMQLPSRGWKLYRTGALGEMHVYGQELLDAGIPAFWAGLKDLQTIHVFRVQYLQDVSSNATVVCQNEQGQLGAISFNWSEVGARVKGLLPIFEDVVDLGAWKKLQRKEQTQDYAQVYDLHLHQRNCIIRFCTGNYQFQQGVLFDSSQPEQAPGRTTARINWNQLSGFLDSRMSDLPLWSDFTPFAETALEHFDLIDGFHAHIDLFRKADTHWDPAFHLYSTLIFRHTFSMPKPGNN